MRLCIFVSLFVSVLFLFSQDTKYSRVKVFLENKPLSELAKTGVPTDHGEFRKHYSFTTDYSSMEIEWIKNAGFKLEILIDDVVKHYVDQNNNTDIDSHVERSSAVLDCQKPPKFYPSPQGFSLGSMGGFFTYQEALDHLDSMAVRYPHLITIRDTMNYRTREGRHVYWLKISDNVNVDENEPEILYNAIHHAREPNSIAQLIFYMYYLLENYGVDDEVTYLVDNLEMYFVPCINPDGYIYNEQTNPNGGGMWRKNRRDNGNGKFGVDLNRNYGFSWGLDNIGSSGNPNSDTYRGDAAFSEPETQNMRDFCLAHDFKIALNYHTYGDLLIYPWGYDYSIFTPDSAGFVEFAMEMTNDNQYVYGTGDQTVGYIVNGDSDDWMYGEQTTKSKIFSMTPEAGPHYFGFWPPANDIEGLCRQNIWQNLSAAHLLLNYGVVNEKDEPFLRQVNGFVHYELKSLGLSSDSLWVKVYPLNNISFTDTMRSYFGLSHLQEVTDSMSYSLSSGIVSGDSISYVILVSNGAIEKRDTIDKIFGPSEIIFEENGDSIQQWQLEGSWNSTASASMIGPTSISDSPSGPYGNYLDDEIKTVDFIDLTSTTHAFLEFYARWQIEQNFDYVELFAELTNGTQTVLCSGDSREGSSYQNVGMPVYDGMLQNWERQVVDLSDFLGSQIKIGFKINSDAYTEFDGFYFDELKLYALTNNVSNDIVSNDIMYLNVYPNPASQYIQIEHKYSSNTFLRVYDIMGKVIFEEKLKNNNGTIDIDINDWSVGVYKIVAHKETDICFSSSFVKY